MELKNKTTTELKVLKEKLEFELLSRVHEVEMPILKMVSNGEHKFTLDMLNKDTEKTFVLNEMESALIDKDRTFNITLVMIAESDYNSLAND